MRQHPFPGPLQAPHRVIGPQSREGALDLHSCSSQRPRLSLDIIAFLPQCGERARLSLRQATQSLTTVMEGSPGALPQAAFGLQPRRRQLPRAAVQRQAACGRLAGNSGRPPLYLPTSLGLVLIKNWNFPNCPKAWSWSLPSLGLGTKVRAGQDPGGRATGSAEGILAEG